MMQVDLSRKMTWFFTVLISSRQQLYKQTLDALQIEATGKGDMAGWNE